MTENEAIKNINALNAVCMNKEFYDTDFYLALSLAVGALEKVQQFEAIGTVEEFKALKEKSVAKKPIETMMCYKAVWKCPTCSSRLYSGQPHCEECGQAILDDYEDWQ